MSGIEALTLFEDMYLTPEAAQSRRFKDCCYALDSFLTQDEVGEKVSYSPIDSALQAKKSQLVSLIINRLDSYGFPLRSPAVKYITYCIFCKSSDSTLGMMKLYELCGEHFGVSAKSVENTCRYACTRAEKIDRRLCTFYENVTVKDVVFGLSTELDKTHNIGALFSNPHLI